MEKEEQAVTTDELARKILDGEALTEDERRKASAIMMLVSQHLYERGTAMFICGTLGKTGPDGLPDGVLVCPSYGSDAGLTTAYMRRDK